MELIKDVVVDFCLFSLIEGFILCKFYEKICKLNKFKFNEIFILSLGNCLISTLFPPVFYQIIIILWIGMFLKIFRKINYNFGLKYGLFSMIFVLITETPIVFLLNLLNIKIENIYYILFIILKIIELFILKFMEENNETLVGRSA